MGISRQLQQRTTPARPEVGYTPTWQDFPEGVMSAIMQGMVEARFIDIDGTIWEYRWKPVNGFTEADKTDGCGQLPIPGLDPA